MAELTFDCLGVRPDRYAASPTLLFRLRLAETTGEPVHTVALRCQLRIEPQKRRYSAEEAERLTDLFGERARWADTLRPVQFAFASQLVPGFTGSTEVDLPVLCTFDLDVAATKYFAGLADGEIPLVLLFSGTVFGRAPGGLSVQPVPWHKEANCRLPVSVWRELMDLHFPGSAWVRVRRDTLEDLMRYRSRLALLSWDETFERLLKAQEDPA